MAAADPNYWDPLAIENEEPSPQCLLRVKKDIAIFNVHPPYGIFIVPQEENVTKIHALIVGPSDTPYEGGTILLRLEVSLGVSYGSAQGPQWNPMQTIESVLVSIQSLLNENPFENEPGASFFSPISKFLGYEDNYNSFLQHETLRVAVCDTVQACLDGTSPLPPALREQVLKTFSESFAKYEKMAADRVKLTGTQLRDRFLRVKGVYQYERLLKRLKDLNDRVKKRNQVAPEAEDE
ncbi:hypothetical protein MRX96_003349 [Rhipicephalus microplus]